MDNRFVVWGSGRRGLKSTKSKLQNKEVMGMYSVGTIVNTELYI